MSLLLLYRLLLLYLLIVLLLHRLRLRRGLLRLLIILLLLNRLLLLHLLIVLLLHRLLLYRLLLYRLLLLRLLIVLLLRRLLWWGLSDLEIEPTNFISFRNPLQPFQELNKVSRQLPALGVTIAIVQTVNPQSLPGIDNDLLVSLHVIGSSDEIFERLTDLDVVLAHDAYLDLGAVFVDLLRFVVLLLDEGKITQQIERCVDFFSVVLSPCLVECLINNPLRISILSLGDQLRCVGEIVLPGHWVSVLSAKGRGA